MPSINIYTHILFSPLLSLTWEFRFSKWEFSFVRCGVISLCFLPSILFCDFPDSLFFSHSLLFSNSPHCCFSFSSNSRPLLLLLLLSISPPSVELLPSITVFHHGPIVSLVVPSRMFYLFSLCLNIQFRVSLLLEPYLRVWWRCEKRSTYHLLLWSFSWIFFEDWIHNSFCYR